MSNSKYNQLQAILKTKHHIIMAPMFLVSNEAMVIEALGNGISAAFPAHNYRNKKELVRVIRSIKEISAVPFGVNLICNKSNLHLKWQLEACVEEGIGYVISSLGSPKELIKSCHKVGIPVLCDVVDLKYALKVEDLGADGVIAVNKRAGGHAGGISAKELIKQLNEALAIPVISAGGIGDKGDVESHYSYGAVGVSVGTVFIATEESPVRTAYKDAIVNYGEKDIVLTKRLSGTPSTVINTPYVQKMNLKPSFLERLMRWFPRFKKPIKTLIVYLGSLRVRKAAFEASYQTVWCAGPIIEKVNKISSVKEVIQRLIN